MLCNNWLLPIGVLVQWSIIKFNEHKRNQHPSKPTCSCPLAFAYLRFGLAGYLLSFQPEVTLEMKLPLAFMFLLVHITCILQQGIRLPSLFPIHLTPDCDQPACNHYVTAFQLVYWFIGLYACLFTVSFLNPIK